MSVDEHSLLNELNKMRQQVEFLLGKYPESRNNDFYLSILWLREFGGLKRYISFIPYDCIRELSGKTETLSRIRRKIQNNDGLYLPTDLNVMKKRRQREQNYRKVILDL